jgi:putative transposase
VRASFPEYESIYAKVLESPITHVDKGFKNFFRRVKLGFANPGFPRFKTRDRYNSFVYKQHGFKLEERSKNKGLLFLSKIGKIPVKNWKILPLTTRIKRITIKQVIGKWFAVLCCEIPNPTPIFLTKQTTGIDVGLQNLVMDASGKSYGNLSFIKQQEQDLRKVQKSLSRKTKGSNRRHFAKLRLQKHHQKLVRTRKYQQYQIANQLVRSYDVIGVEKLNIPKMLSSGRPQHVPKRSIKGFHRNIGLAGWGQQLKILTYKAEEAGKRVVAVDPRGTSQICSMCGDTVTKTLRDRWHSCPSCGLSISRDHNSARNIEQRALLALRGEEGSRSSSLKREIRVGKLSKYTN